MNTTACRLVLVVLGGAIAFTADAELQNVVVNGGYGMNDDQRFVHQWGLTGDRRLQSPWSPTHFVMNPHSGRCSQTFNDVDVPDRPVPKSFSNMGRVFLSFYVAVPSWGPGDEERIDVTVYADDYRVFRREFTEPGFHLCLVDMGPWAGKEVSLRFNAGWFDGEAQRVLVALPRLLAWHGPLRSGRGGLEARGTAHGFTPLGFLHESELDRYSKRVGVTFALTDCEWLVVPRVDCITPSTVLSRWQGNWERINLQLGFHWLPIAISEEIDQDWNVRVIEGAAEAGPVDKIPNFLRHDAGRLYWIVDSIKYSKQ